MKYSTTVMHRLLMGPQSREYFLQKYPNQSKNYQILVRNLGPACPNAKACLKYIYLKEVAELGGEEFRRRVEEGDWKISP